MPPNNKQPLIECVPNFSEGRNPETIQAIATSIEQVHGVKLLHIDSGIATNRTVITFAGSPEAVIEAAFQSIKCAARHIDMREQKGVHPRFGATDVCPLIPVANISMEEVVKYSLKLAKRVGDELKIPVYLYERSASSPERSNLANLRKDNYEAIVKKIHLPEWKPDFGPQKLNARSGNIAIGARSFLIACNINLKSEDIAIAKAIAREIRSSGYIDKSGIVPEKWKRMPGKCTALKAIGWYIPEYNCVQVSMNITDYTKTGIHHAYEAVKAAAKKRGVIVSGTELIGLVPKTAILDAGKYYASAQKHSVLSEQELIEIAVYNLRLDILREFKPEERILEYVLQGME
ncbi:MAG: glutamate formimidoyltransferase [Chitinophagales bacterium]